MAKINDTEVYNLQPQPELLDFLIGTKKNGKRTFNFSLESIIQLINGTNAVNNILFQFSDGLDPDINYTTSGSFFTETNSGIVSEFKELIFNKKTRFPINLTLLFKKLGTTQNVVFTLKNPEDPNNFIKLKVVSFVDNRTHFVFGVEPYENLYIGGLVNEKIYSLYFEVITSSESDRFTSSGTTNLVGNSLSISIGYAWLINGSNYANTTPFNFTIPLASLNNQRIDLFVVDRFNNIIRIQGVESVSSPVKPDVPQNTLELTFVLVSDAEIADPVLPNFGETFVEKIEKTEISVNTNNIFDVSSRVANFILGNNVVQCSGINFTDNSVYYDGKKYSFKNISTTDKILKNRTLVGNVRFVFPNELDFILKPGEIVEFILRKRKFLFLEYVGVLAQKRTFNWHQKGKIYTNVFGELNAGKWLQTHIFDPNSYAINTFQTNSNLIPVNYSTSEFQIPFDCKLISVTGIGAAIDGTDVVIFCSTNLQGNNKVQIYSGIFPNFSSSTIVIADYKIVKNSFIHVFYKKYTAGQNFYMHNIIFEEI